MSTQTAQPLIWLALVSTRFASRARTGVRLGALARPVLVDGLPGVLIMVGGRPVTVIAFTVTGGVITAIYVLNDPDRLAQVVPSWIT